MEAWILLIEALCVYGLVLVAHALRVRFGLAHYYALIGGLTAIMSWVTDAGVMVTVGPVTFLVGSTVFYTALLLGVFVIYVFDGPKAARIAISTVIGISILVPLFATILHAQMLIASNNPLGQVPMPSLRINLASVLTTLADLLFLAVAWEFLNHRSHRVPLPIRTFLTLLGVMSLDVILFNTGAFAGTPRYLSVMAGTFSDRIVVAACATPVLWAYLAWQTHKQGVPITRRPILAIVRELTDVKLELSTARRELALRRQAEHALHESEKRYRELIDHALEGILVVQDQTVHLVNPRASMLLGKDPASRDGDLFTALFVPEDRPRAERLLTATAPGSGEHTDELRVSAAGGSLQWLSARAVAIQWHGKPASLVLLADITERKAAEARLLARANTDALTGLCNRGHFFELAEREIANAERHGTPLSLLIIDVDHFKSVNDTHGHPVGDAVLRHLTRLLAAELRGADRVGRIGGEEFAALLPGADAAQARAIAERLRRTVQQGPAQTARGPIPITVSVGFAEHRQGTADLPSLIKRADDALLAAKEHGRNRVESDYSAPLPSGADA